MPIEDKLSELQGRVAELKRKKQSSDKFVKTGKKRNVDHQSALNSVAGSERFHGLDFLRAMAMLMGLVFHAPMLYYIPVMADGFKDFGVSSATMPPMEAWLSAIVYWLHSWRMTVFFMISGFFTALVLSKRTTAQFITDRFIKLALTTLLFASLFDLMDGRFDGKLEHIWFLYYLFIFSCITGFFATLKPPSKNTEKSHHSTKAIIILLIIAAILVAVRPALDQLDGGHVGVASHYHTIKFGGFLYFFAWFCSGMWLYSNRVLLVSANSMLLTTCSLIAAAGVFYILLPDLSGIWGYGATPAETEAEAFRISLLKGLNAVLWAVFFTLTTHQVMKKSNKILDWLVTLSFPIYIFHLTPCIVLSAVLIGMGLSQFQVVIGVVFGAFAISVFLYYLLIKFTPLSWIILGYKNSWLQPFKKKV